jgi:cysteine-rich repeat protein
MTARWMMMSALLSLAGACYPEVVDGQFDCDATGLNACPTGTICLPKGAVHRCYSSPGTCGDGILEAGEQCDGADFGDYRCEDYSPEFLPGVPRCTGLCTVQCASCGNAVVEPGEECDAGGLNSDTAPDACRRDCRLARCGDGALDTGEVCDDGNEVNGDGCSANCRPDRVCGNGILDLEIGEGCDDGNGVGGDGCSADCAVEAGWTCHGTEPSVCVIGVFVTLPAGTFLMGSPTDEPGHGSGLIDETQHLVTLTRGFEIQTTEVTQGQFEAMMGYNPSYDGECGASCPVEFLSWHEAAAYSNGLSAQAGLAACYTCSFVTCEPSAAYATPYDCPGYRLPTEAEWEYAARAGTTDGTYHGTSTLLACEQPNAVLDPIAWFCGSAEGRSHATGGKAANAWGLYDLLGNVWEWVHDGFDVYPGEVTDPWGPAAGSIRMVRGGSFINDAQHVRSAMRGNADQSDQWSNLGFRPARSL